MNSGPFELEEAQVTTESDAPCPGTSSSESPGKLLKHASSSHAPGQESTWGNWNPVPCWWERKMVQWLWDAAWPLLKI